MHPLSENKLPASWPIALAAILPGALATLGLVKTDFSTSMLVGLGLLALNLAAAYISNRNHLPAWSLVAAGFLVGIGLIVVLGIMAGLLALVAGRTLMEFSMPVILGLVCIALFALAQRDRPLAPRTWFLVGLITVCQLAVRFKYFILFGYSWSVAGQWLSISFYALLSSILLPLAIGLCRIRHHGEWAMLFIIGTTYISFELLTDINEVVSVQVGPSPQFMLYRLLVPLLFTILAPLWFVRRTFGRGRVVALLVGIAVMFDLLIVLTYGDYPLLIWLSAIPYTLGMFLTLTLAFQLFSMPVSTSQQPTS